MTGTGVQWEVMKSNMYDRVMKKIKSSSHTRLNNERLIDELEQRLKDGRSPLGQDNASYCICHFDEDRFPQYLIDNKEKYSYLIK